jgi:antitoxin VapB
VRAKLFTNGRSQAVRLPKEFRFEGKEVQIRKFAGGVLLEPVQEEHKPWRSIEELYARFEDADPIFPEGREQPEAQERDWSSFG